VDDELQVSAATDRKTAKANPPAQDAKSKIHSFKIPKKAPAAAPAGVTADTPLDLVAEEEPAAPAARDAVLSVAQLQCLFPDEWLNDAVIFAWMTYVADRNQRLNDVTAGCMPSVYIMETFAYTKMSPRGGFDYTGVRRWTKKVDLFGKDMIFFPLHQGTHWALAVVNMRAKKIQYFDSMGGERKADT
jgi:hypothetical protein